MQSPHEGDAGADSRPAPGLSAGARGAGLANAREEAGRPVASRAARRRCPAARARRGVGREAVSCRLVTTSVRPPPLPSTPVSPLVRVSRPLDASPVDERVAAVTVDPAQRIPVADSAPLQAPLQAVGTGPSRPSMTWRVATAATAVVVLGAAVLLLRHPWRNAVVTAEPPASQPVLSRPSTPNDSLGTLPATGSGVPAAPLRDTARIMTPAAGGTSAPTTASQTVQAPAAAPPRDRTSQEPGRRCARCVARARVTGPGARRLVTHRRSCARCRPS